MRLSDGEWRHRGAVRDDEAESTEGRSGIGRSFRLAREEHLTCLASPSSLMSLSLFLGLSELISGDGMDDDTVPFVDRGTVGGSDIAGSSLPSCGISRQIRLRRGA